MSPTEPVSSAPTRTTTPKGKRLVVHPGQAPVLIDQTRFQVVVAGRRWGKTELACLKLVRASLQKPGLYRYVAPSAVLARKTAWRRKLRRAIDPSWWAKSPNESRMEYTFRNGSILEVMGAEDPVGLLGEGVDGIVLDEYASMRGDVWTEYVLPSLADTEGFALFIGTPKSFNHFHGVFELGQNEDRPEWRSWQFRSIDNPLIAPEIVQQAREVTDPRTFRQEWEASFETIAGRTYYAFTRYEHVGPVTWDVNLPARVSFDFNVEPATAVLGQNQGDRPVVWREVYLSHRGGEATEASAQAVRQLLTDVGHRGEIRIYGDATGRSAKTTGPSDHAVLRRVFEGATWCVTGRNPHEKDRIAAVNAVCETESGINRLIVDPVNTHLIADLEQVITAPDGAIDKKSNPDLTHISDAFGYWIVRDYPTVVKTAAGLARAEWLL